MSIKGWIPEIYLPRSYYVNPRTMSTAELIISLKKCIDQDYYLQQRGVDTEDVHEVLLNQAEFMSELEFISDELLRREKEFTEMVKETLKPTIVVTSKHLVE